MSCIPTRFTICIMLIIIACFFYFFITIMCSTCILISRTIITIFIMIIAVWIPRTTIMTLCIRSTTTRSVTISYVIRTIVIIPASPIMSLGTYTTRISISTYTTCSFLATRWSTCCTFCCRPISIRMSTSTRINSFTTATITCINCCCTYYWITSELAQVLLLLLQLFSYSFATSLLCEPIYNCRSFCSCHI